METATPVAAASDPSQLRAFQNSGLAVHPACTEFEPQNLGIVSVNATGQIFEANAAFLSMSGYSATDLPLDFVAITPPEWHELDSRKARQLAENGQCLPWQKQILTKKGHLLSILIGAAALNLTENRFQYFIANTEGHLNADVVILDYQSRLRSAAVELSMAAERERQAIAGELHDDIGQALAIAKLKLSKLRAETNGTVRAALDEITAQVGVALGSCRTLSRNLATHSLHNLGLVPAIKDLVALLNQESKLDISLHFYLEDIPLSRTTKIILFRVVRELLINILKHAEASAVEIYGTRVGDMLCIVVADDGVGCNVPGSFYDSSPESGLGLFLVRERMWHIGGSFELHSTKGGGTRATLMAPLEISNQSAGPPA